MKLECNECFILFEATETQEMFCSTSCKTLFDDRLAKANKLVDSMLKENSNAIRATRVQNNSVSAQNLITLIRTTQDYKTDKKED